MKSRINKFLKVGLLLLITVSPIMAQIQNPVKWKFSSHNLKNGEVELILKATIEDGWHLYSQFIAEGGPIPTSFSFETSRDYTLIKKVVEKSNLIKDHDKAFDMDIAFFEHEAIFVQKIKAHSTSFSVSGKLQFMVCNDLKCLPPEDIDFKIDVKGVTLPTSSVSAAADTKNTALVGTSNISQKDTSKQTANNVVTVVSDTNKLTKTDALHKTEVALNSSGSTSHTKAPRSLWAIFIGGLLGGLAAFLMPCIFPMLPFTVSYFTKSESKSGGIAQALTYGFFIIAIYVLLGLVITIIFGADALNNLATNGIFNIFFFLLLVVFAISFFGAFEIVLPSSWANKADAQSSKGGFLGLFFMAATLSIVSFSCTGPIIGTLLVEAASLGHLMGPAVGMLGFSISLALPFMLFSMFPSWLKSMPKSGGWLNSIKVVLGFLELALALKFLSNVDLAYHWNWFDREVYLSLWIIIFGLLGFYLLGKLRLPHDSEVTHISAFRLFLAIGVLSFTLYMIPGLWGAPLKAVSAFLPPQQSQDFDLYTPTLTQGHTVTNQTSSEPRKYGDLFHAPYGLNAYFDYDEGLKQAAKEHKPVMIDFTGHACVNCRKMEADVWTDPKVMEAIRNKYILIQLYVDDKTELPENEKYTSTFSSKKVKTIGNKWSDFQASRFNANSQPFYVLLNDSGKLLIDPQGADYNTERYLTYLNKGIEAFEKQ